MKVSKKLGDTLIEMVIEGTGEADALQKATVLTSMPQKCSCGSTDLKLDTFRVQGYKYTKLICNECGAKAELSSYRDGGSYWKGFKKFAKASGAKGSLNPEKKISQIPESGRQGTGSRPGLNLGF